MVLFQLWQELLYCCILNIKKMDSTESLWFISVLASAVLFGIAGFILKFGAFHSYSVPHILLGLYSSGAAGFLLFGILTNQFDVNVMLLIAGLVVGAGSMAGNILFMKALRVGPVSLTSPVVNLNIVLVVVMSIIIFGESLGVNEIIGIVIVIIFVSLLPVDPNERISIIDKKWYLFAGVAIVLFFFRNGGLKITEEFGMNNTMVLFYGYLLGILWSWVLTHRSRKAVFVQNKTVVLRQGLYTGLIAGLFSFGGMQLYAIALANGPASIVSPVFASNSLITGLLAIGLLKERLSVFQIIAVIGILSGIILIRI
jgi:drug/metabolite transporter (DMT)-like permease